MGKNNFEEEVSDLLANQYLKHKSDFHEWMNNFMEKKPMHQLPGEDLD